MKLSEGIFAVKLYELEQEYGRMQSRLHVCRRQDHSQMIQELQRLKEEYEQTDFLLKQRIEGSRSAQVRELARAQLAYQHQVEKILESQKAACRQAALGPGRKGLDHEGIEKSAEAAALYAEYAIDFAEQSMKYALIAAMTAIELQMHEEEEEKTDE